MFPPPPMSAPTSCRPSERRRPVPPRRRRFGALALAGAVVALAGAAIRPAAGAPSVAGDSGAARPRRIAQQPPSGITCIGPDRDATVDSERPTSTLGLDGSLQVARERAVPVKQRWSYLHFPTSTLPSGVVFVSASLRLIVEDATGLAPYSQAILAATSLWDEQSITWNNRPRVTGAYGNVVFGSQAMTVTADVTPLVGKWLDGLLPNHGLALEPDADFDSTWYYSKEYRDPPHEPQLCIEWRRPTATTEPSATATPTASNTSPPRPSATDVPSATPTSRAATATATPKPSDTATAPPTRTSPPSPTPPPTQAPTASPTRPGTGTAVPTPTEASPVLSLTVNDPGNDADRRPGDGLCQTPAGRCTLRAALLEANANAATDVRIVFDRSVDTVAVPDDSPLPPLRRANVGLFGSDAVPAAMRAASPAGPRGAEQAPARVRIVGATSGPPAAGPGLLLDGALGVSIDGMAIEGFAIAIAVTNRSSGVAIGALGGGPRGNRLFRNTIGVAVDGSSTDVEVLGNTIDGNRMNGVLLARTAGGRVRLRANGITGNGSAAIAVAPGGPETAPPVITAVDGRVGVVSGTACPGCVVELFADPGVQAARVTGVTATADSAGKWTARGLVFLPDDTNVTATATRNTDTSRLSDAFPIAAGVAWRLSERPGASPGTLRNRRLVRSYILRDEDNHLVGEAMLRFVPDALNLQFPVRTGLVDVSLPVELAAALFSRKLHASLEAVERSGVRHSVRWSPNLLVAVAQAGARPGDVLLDLLGLGPLGLGARHRLGVGMADADAEAFGGDGYARGRLAGDAVMGTDAGHAVAQGSDDAYAAAYIGAPAELREGPYAWTQNIAMGGGIYELQSGGEAVTGPLEIVAPAAAYNATGPASGCPGSPAGAVICGWKDMGRCWVPLPGSSAEPPGPGAATFVATANVSLPADGAARTHAASAPVQGGEPFTIYTVGFDNTPPVLNSPLTSGHLIIGELPADLGGATDDRSGVDADGGVVVTLDNSPIPVRYDPDKQRVFVTDRTIPDAVPDGPAQLAIRISDGFCNARTATFDVVVVRGSRILLPYACKKCVRP